MNVNRTIGCSCSLFLLSIGVALHAHGADGNELQAVGAVQKGLVGAGVASPKDATWSLLNPAALVDLRRRVDVSLELLYNDFSAVPRGAPFVVNPFARKLRDHNIFVIPSIGIVWPLKKGTLGIGVYGLQGERVDYDRPRSAFGLLSNGDRRMQLEVVKIPISYGYRFDNGWALGASVVPVVTRLRSDVLTPFLRPARGDYHWDTALGIGLQLGVYKHWEYWAFGANYTSRTWMDDYDRYETDLARRNLDLPQKLQLGLAYRPSPNWEFLLDYKWINWSHVHGFGAISTRGGLAWNDQHIVKTGVSWDVSRKWTLRAGLSWGKPPIGDDAVIPNALAPPLTEWHVAAGFSYKLDERSSVHAALSHVFPEERTDNGRGDLFSVFSRGTKVDYAEDAVIAQYSLRF